MFSEFALFVSLALQLSAQPPVHRAPSLVAESATPSTSRDDSPASDNTARAPFPSRAPAWVDHDGDGDADLFLMEAGGGDRLLENRGGGRFVDVTEASGLATRRASRAACWADFDGDGRADLVRVDHRGRAELWRNLGGGAFLALGAEAGLEGLGGVTDARALDLDLDGRPDLQLATERGTRLFLGARAGAFVELVLERGAAGTGGTPAVGATSDAPAAEAAGGVRPDDSPAERGELAAGRRALVPPGAAPPGAPARPNGPGGGFGVSATSAGSGPGVSGGLKTPGVTGCADTIVDVATSTCVEASSDPALGKLYPLGPEFNIDAAGNVGIGTTTPGHHVHVEDASTTGTLLHVESTALTGDVTAIRGTTEGETGTGVTGRAKAVTGVNYGVHGRARSVDGRGVYGEAVSLTGAAVGVEGRSEADAGVGVSGHAASTSGVNHGVHGSQEGDDGAGVLGEALNALGYADGVRGTTVAFGGSGVRGENLTPGSTGAGVSGVTSSAFGTGVSGLASSATGSTYGVAGRSSSNDGVGVYGRHAASTGVGAGVHGETVSANHAAVGVLGEVNNVGAGTDSAGVKGDNIAPDGAGMAGRALATTGSGQGVRGTSAADNGIGVYGVASTTGASDVAFGVSGKIEGTDGSAVIGNRTSDSSVWYSQATGVSGTSDAATGKGVAGFHIASTGAGRGVQGQTDSDVGVGVEGIATATTGSANGVVGETASDFGYGVRGNATNATGVNFGALGTSISPSGAGVVGTHGGAALYAPGSGVSGSTDGTASAGVAGLHGALTGAAKGVYGSTASDAGYGVHGEATSTTGTTVGVKGEIVSPFGFAVEGVATNALGTAFGVGGYAFTSNGAGMFGSFGSPFAYWGKSGVAGSSDADDGFGISGLHDSVAGTGAGMRAITYSQNGFGALAEAVSTTGPSTGVQGTVESSGGTGVRGQASSSTGATVGVHGRVDSTSDGRIGVDGEATGATGLCIGVSGTTVSPDGIGVFGGIGTSDPTFTSPDSVGVVGRDFNTSGGSLGMYALTDSTLGTGIYAAASPTTGFTAGVLGRTYSSTGWGVYGSNLGASGGWGVYTPDDLGCAGTKSFAHPHPSDPTKEIRFVCLEGNESGTYFRGSSALVGGVAVLEVPEDFRMVTERDGLTVQLTALGDARLWVESKGLERIVVRGAPDVEFDYFVNGVRQGFAGHRTVQANRSFHPLRRGEPFGTSLPPAVQERLVATGILNADLTPDEAFAQRMGWELADPLLAGGPVLAPTPVPAAAAHPAPTPAASTSVQGGSPRTFEPSRGTRNTTGDIRRAPAPRTATREAGHDEPPAAGRDDRPTEPPARERGSD